MRPFWQLFLVQQRQQTRFSDKQWVNRLGWPLSLLITAPFFWLFYTFYKGLASVDPHFMLQIALLFTSLGAFVFGIPYLLGSLFHSRDLPRLVPLPLSPATIVGAKLASAYVNDLFTVLLFFGPALVAYAAVGYANPGFWLMGLLISLLLPLLPLGAAALVSLAIGLAARRSKSQDLSQLIGGLLALVFPLAYIAMPEGFFTSQQLNQNSYVTGLTTNFWPVKWGADALQGDLLAFGLYSGLSLLVLALVAWLAQAFYLRSVQALGPRAGRGHYFSEAQFAVALSRQQRPLLAQFWREWRLFFRQPTYILLTFLPILSILAVAGVTLIAQSDLSETLMMVQDPELRPIVWVAATVLVQVGVSMNAASATAISREGRFFWLAKSLPLPPRVQVQGKLLHLCALVGMYLLVACGLALWLIRPPFSHGLLFLTANGLSAVIAVLLGLLIDLRWPKLSWQNPQQAMNNNWNSLFAGLAHLTLLGLVGAGATLVSDLPTSGVLAVGLGVLLLLTTGLYWLVLRVAEPAYSRIRI